MDDLKCKGNYIIVFWNDRQFLFKDARFGNQLITPGYYLYCGSAHGSGGVKARVGRHLRPTKKKQWHIDHIKPKMKPLEIWFEISEDLNECAFIRALEKNPGSQFPLRGFGASDCKEGCISHFIHLPEGIWLNDVFALVAKRFTRLKKIKPEIILR